MAGRHAHHAHERHTHESRSSDRSGRAEQRRVLAIVLAANALFLGVEIVGAVMFHSLVLFADATHMVSDVAALLIALGAAGLVARPATTRHSYGLQRAEVLGAQASGVVLVAVAIWIIVSAVQRLGDPGDVAGGGVLVVGAVGLVVNLASAWALSRARGGSLNMHGAYLHMALDAVGSLAAIVAGVAVLSTGADWIDPLASIIVAVLVLWAAFSLLRDTTSVLLEAVPRGIDPGSIEAALQGDPEVEQVHHLHVWNLASDVAALSVHVKVRGEVTLHDAQVVGDRLKTMLHDEFGIEHATVELECHACDEATHTH